MILEFVIFLAYSNPFSATRLGAINECIELLKFLKIGQESLYSLPNEFEHYEKLEFCVNGNKEIRIDEIFRNPLVKCPSCKSEFSQIAFDVKRTMYAVKCPQCQQCQQCQQSIGF